LESLVLSSFILGYFAAEEIDLILVNIVFEHSLHWFTVELLYLPKVILGTLLLHLLLLVHIVVCSWIKSYTSLLL
jgi:putative effector of murein hydrolase LrgA (UPF0299 family)